MDSATVRTHLLIPRPLPREQVPLPELGEGAAVLVQAFTAARAERWEKSLYRVDENGLTVRDTTDFGAKLIVAACVDEDGNPLFTETDIPALNAQDGTLIHRIVLAAIRLCGLGPKEIEDAARDFTNAPTTALPSDWPTI